MGHTKDTAITSGIQVLDRAVSILTEVAKKPLNLTQLCEITGLPRATAHRIAVALEKHRLIERLPASHWAPGPALRELAPTADTRLEDAAEFILPPLMEKTGESVQLYRIAGHQRICIANAEPSTGLRDTVPVGTRMTLQAGSAAKILVAFGPRSLQEEILPTATYTEEELTRIRAQGIAQSYAERDPSLTSVSVPIIDATGTLLGALSISGPVGRIGPEPAQRFGQELTNAAHALQARL